MSKLSANNVLFNLFYMYILENMYIYIVWQTWYLKSRQFIGQQKEDRGQKDNNQLFASYDLSNRWVDGYMHRLQCTICFALCTALCLPETSSWSDSPVSGSTERRKREEKQIQKHICLYVYNTFTIHIQYIYNTYIYWQIFQTKYNMT